MGQPRHKTLLQCCRLNRLPGFFKPVHVKSLPANAIRSLIIARKKLVGQRVTLENQIRGLAAVFGDRLPRALTAGFIDQALKASEGVAGLSAAMRGLAAAGAVVMTAIAAMDADMRRMTRAFAARRRLMTIPGVGHTFESTWPGQNWALMDRLTSIRDVRLLGTNSARRGVRNFFQERSVLAHSFRTGYKPGRAATGPIPAISEAAGNSASTDQRRDVHLGRPGRRRGGDRHGKRDRAVNPPRRPLL